MSPNRIRHIPRNVHKSPRKTIEQPIVESDDDLSDVDSLPHLLAETRYERIRARPRRPSIPERKIEAIPVERVQVTIPPTAGRTTRVIRLICTLLPLIQIMTILLSALLIGYMVRYRILPGFINVLARPFYILNSLVMSSPGYIREARIIESLQVLPIAMTTLWCSMIGLGCPHAEIKESQIGGVARELRLHAKGTVDVFESILAVGGNNELGLHYVELVPSVFEMIVPT